MLTRLLTRLVLCAMVLSPVLCLRGQESVTRLQDLIGVRARDAESRMKERGYTFLRSDPSGNQRYDYFTENRSGRCVTVRVSDGRYTSIAYIPDFDCKNPPPGNTGGASSAASLQDLVGARASSGESQLRQRGYRLVRNEVQGQARMNYWQRGRECVAIEVFDGKYSYLNSVSNDECTKGGGAQSGPANLQDLVGARASSGESQLRQRGYRLVRNEVQGQARMNYWQRGRECVAIEVFNGKYSYLNSVSNDECTRGGGGGDRGGPGRMTWRGRVDNRVEISIRGNRCWTRTLAGVATSGETYNMSNSMPRNDLRIEVRKRDGRGNVRLIESPNRSNDFTARIEIEDGKGGADNYEIEVEWN